MHQLIDRSKAFIAGMLAFRDSVTIRYDDLSIQDAYDHGRETAHRLTLRRYDL